MATAEARAMSPSVIDSATTMREVGVMAMGPERPRHSIVSPYEFRSVSVSIAGPLSLCAAEHRVSLTALRLW